MLFLSISNFFNFVCLFFTPNSYNCTNWNNKLTNTTEDEAAMSLAQERVRSLYEQLNPLQYFGVTVIERDTDLNFDGEIHQAEVGDFTLFV